MERYIDADLLRKEVEKRIEETESMKPVFDQFWEGQISAFKGVIKLIDSLQQEHPEIDLEKEIEEYWSTMGWNKVIELRKFRPIARYFYGLGQLNSK